MPRWLRRFRLRLRSLFRTTAVDRELDEELRYHLEREIEERVAAGLPVEEARAAARRSMGATARSREECRDARGVNSIEHRMQDLLFAARQLLKHPGFASAAILVLGLGIAASAAIFAFVDAALIRPLPYTEPSRLVTVFGARPELAGAQRRGAVSYLDFLDWRERDGAFSSLAAYDVRSGFTLTTRTGPERVPGSRVTSGFFRTLGVKPILGREFDRDEEGRAAPPTVLLSYRAWQTRFGGRADIVGRTVTLQSPWLAGGDPHVIIGVLPRDFHFPMATHAEFWTTIRGSQACWEVRSCRSLETVARLADDVSPQRAEASVTSIVDQLRREHPDHHRHQEVARVVPIADVMLGDVRPVLLMLSGAAALLLLIAGINVVSLLLARADARTREIAVRNALGASSMRLMLQFATEAALLVALSTVLAVILSGWSIPFLASLLSVDMIARMPYLEGLGLNLRLVAFASVVALAAWVAFALTPAVRVRMSEAGGLKEGSRGAAGTTWRRFGTHLVVAQLAVAVLLLVSAGLLGKSLYRLLHVDTGFNLQQLAAVSITPVAVRTGPAERAPAAHDLGPGDLARRVAERVAALPGVESVGYADLLPLASGLAPSSIFWVVGRADEGQLREDWPVRRISAGYFETLQARLLRGRHFTEEEVAAARPVLIINETAARRYFPGEDPIGRSIAFGGPASPVREIVGVVADIKDGPPETPPHPSAYVPFDQAAFGLVIRTSQPGLAWFPALVAAIHEIRPDAVVDGGTTMTDRIGALPSASLQRSSAWLVGGFAAIAFVLSVVGLYAVVAYSVGQRRREIGVRMALGARGASICRLVLQEAGWLIAAGTTLGVVCAVIAATLMRHMLFEVQSWDASAIAGAAGVLMVSALLASYIPARRAASVNPIEVLRTE